MLTHYASNERNDQHPLRAYVYVTSRRNRSNIYPKRYLNFVSLFFHHSSHSIFVSQLLTLDAYLRPLATARRERRTLAVESRAAFFIVVVLLLTSLIPFRPPYARAPFIPFFATPTCIYFGSFVARVSTARAFEKRFETYTLQPQSAMRNASCQRASSGIENPTMPMMVPFDGHLNAQKAPRGDHETMLLLIPDR